MKSRYHYAPGGTSPRRRGELPAVEPRGPAAPVYATGRPLRQADGAEAGGASPPRDLLEGLLPILTPADVAKLFQMEGRPDKVVWRLQRAGLRVIRLGRQARVLRSDLEKFLGLGQEGEP